jgi:HTH-type transcriptional regulator/antitoxin HigA
MATVLAAAFGNTPDDWLSLDAQYRLSLITSDPSEVEKRRTLFEVAPVREMQRRGWITETKNLDDVEAELKSFFEVDSLNAEIGFPVAMRRTVRLPYLNKAERAWCFRARQLARAVHTNRFRDQILNAAQKELRILAAHPKEASRVSEILTGSGIRFVVVEPLPNARIDGAAFWLDEESPAIAVSIRYDRIDNFWFTLMHEFSHVKHRDNLSIDNDLQDSMKVSKVMPIDDRERRANEESQASLVPPNELDSFIRRVGPLYSKTRINQFAHRIKIHPGIIVGQLFHHDEIGPSANREMLVKIRRAVIETSLTDGWGKIAPHNLQ